MSKQKLRTCCVCRKNYHFCPRCNEDKDKPAWYFTFCSSNCKDIYDITSQFENNWITANDAKRILDNLDLSDIENFGQSYKNSVAKINVFITDTITEDAIIETEKVIEEFLNTEQVSINESTTNKSRKKTKNNIE